MNKEYLRNFYELYKEEFLDSEYEITSYEELEDYIFNIISCNLQYDYGVNIDIDKLLNLK